MKTGMGKRCRLAALWTAATLAAAGCAGTGGPPVQEAGENPAAELMLDGEAWDGLPADGTEKETRVLVTLDGKQIAELPFREAHTLTVRQADGAENTVILTGSEVRMEDANCENQDCVKMGAVTRENLETRVLGGFIVCLPHRLSVEVRTPE